MDSPSRSHSYQHRPKNPSLLSRALQNQASPSSASGSGSSHASPRPSSSHSAASVGTSPSPATIYATPPRHRPVFHPPSPASVTRGGSTVPFDFAGSERAAREAAARDTPPRLGAVAGKEIVPRKRIVRKKSLVQRVKDLPSTVVDKVVFFSLNVNLDALARPLGLSLAALQFLLRAPIWGSGRVVEGRKSVLRAAGAAAASESRKWEGRFGTAPKAARGAQWVNITTFLSLALLLVSLCNALYLFSRTRAYRLQMRANPASVGSPNARVVDMDEPLGKDDAFSPGPGGADDRRGWVEKAKDVKVWVEGGKVLLPYLNPLPPLWYLLSMPPPSHPPPPRPTRNQVIELSIWHPPTFALALFSVFPPASALILHLLVPSAPLAAALCAFVVGYSGERVGGMWERRGRDREVLGGEVLREYDQRFVYPNLFKQRREVSVQTHEAEMVWERSVSPEVELGLGLAGSLIAKGGSRIPTRGAGGEAGLKAGSSSAAAAGSPASSSPNAASARKASSSPTPPASTSVTSTRPPSPDPRSLAPLLAPGGALATSPNLPSAAALDARTRPASGQQSSRVIAGLQETVVELRAEVQRAKDELRAERAARVDEKAKMLALLEARERDALELTGLRASSARKERQLAELQRQSSSANDQLDTLRTESEATLDALHSLQESSQQSQDRILLAEHQYATLQASFASLQSSFAERIGSVLDAIKKSKTGAEDGLAQAVARKSAVERERAEALARKEAVLEERRALDERFLEAWGGEMANLKQDVRLAGSADARVLDDVNAINFELSRLRKLVALAGQRSSKADATLAGAGVVLTPPVSGSVSMVSAFELDDP